MGKKKGGGRSRGKGSSSSTSGGGGGIVDATSAGTVSSSGSKSDRSSTKGRDGECAASSRPSGLSHRSSQVALALQAALVFGMYLQTVHPTIQVVHYTERTCVLLSVCDTHTTVWRLCGLQGGDSGELATEACRLGIAHPPGYPLLTLLGYVAGLVPTGHTHVYATNVLNAGEGKHATFTQRVCFDTHLYRGWLLVVAHQLSARAPPSW